jgi:hypothetical protein
MAPGSSDALNRPSRASCELLELEKLLWDRLPKGLGGARLRPARDVSLESEGAHVQRKSIRDAPKVHGEIMKDDLCAFGIDGEGHLLIRRSTWGGGGRGHRFGRRQVQAT